MPKGTSLHVVNLKPSSKEYKDVVSKFEQTMPKVATGIVQVQQAMRGVATGTGYSSILQIQRIQNLVLFSQYMAKKKEMDKNNKPGHQNEVHLFHGTAPDTCPKINQQGFNRSFSGKNGEFGLRLGYKGRRNS
jgi:poly [ADP-ribose] polymerase 10/14/15